MLTNSNFESNTQFLFWANVIFNIQGILQSCPTQILSCSDTTVFVSEQKRVYFSKTHFSCQQKHIFQIAKDVSKVSRSSNMHINVLHIQYNGTCF